MERKTNQKEKDETAGPDAHTNAAAPTRQAPAKDSIKDLAADAFLLLLEQKPFEKITVQDITLKAGISRQSFYNHFADRQELIHWIYDNRIIPEYDFDNLDLDFSASLEACFVRMKQYGSFLVPACRDTSQNCLSEHIMDHAEEFDLQWIESVLKQPLNAQMRFAIRYHARASCSMSISWILSGMRDSPQAMAQLLVQMRSMGIEGFLEDTGNPNPYHPEESAFPD